MSIRKKHNVTPEQAVEILKKHGTLVTVDEAKIILDLMYKFAKLAVNQVIKNNR